MEITLKTERLVLRPFDVSDVEDILAYSAEEEWSYYLSPGPFPYPYERSDAERFVERNAQVDWESEASFVIEFDGRAIGSIHLGGGEPKLAGELAFMVARAFWGKGLTSEAGRTVLDFGFRELGLARVYARADARNLPSVRVMEKLGMRREGLLRLHRVDRRGGRADEAVYGILRDEWEALRGS